MRIVIALGGNALLRRGEAFSVAQQRDNVHAAVTSLSPLLAHNEVVITHGNGPQVGFLALQASAYSTQSVSFDILGAQTEGMIGFMLVRELGEIAAANCVALVTQVEVDPNDPAFAEPTKFIGPRYDNDAVTSMRKQHLDWAFARQGELYRRVVPSPKPQRIIELATIDLLLRNGVVVVCAGGGGVPVVYSQPNLGLDAVVDKDLASACLARELDAQELIMLTDVDGVRTDWGKASERILRQANPQMLSSMEFERGSMGPKVEAALDFCQSASDVRVRIGALEQMEAIFHGRAGTEIGVHLPMAWWD